MSLRPQSQQPEPEAYASISCNDADALCARFRECLLMPKERWTSPALRRLWGRSKTFAIYAGAVICFGGLIFAGIRMMSGRFQDAIPGLFGASIRRWRSWLGCGLDWLPYRPETCRGLPWHTTKRGEPLPINQALNRPRAKLGLDLSAWMAIVFVTVTVFLVGFPNAGDYELSNDGGAVRG